MPELFLGQRRIWYRHGNDRHDPAQPTVVFVHGAGGSSLTWIYQLRALRRSLNCVAPDLPGHGKSDDDTALTTIADYAEALLGILDALALEHVALVGHSMGAAVALECVRRAPGRFGALAALGAGPLIPVSPLIIEALRGTGQVYVRFLEDLAFSPTTPRRFVEKTTAAGLPAPREVVTRDFRACEGWDRRGQLAQIDLPSLLVVGRDDAMTPVPLVESLAAELRGARVRLEIVEDAGHMVMIEQHKHVNELLAAFIAAALPAQPAGANTPDAIDPT